MALQCGNGSRTFIVLFANSGTNNETWNGRENNWGKRDMLCDTGGSTTKLIRSEQTMNSNSLTLKIWPSTPESMLVNILTLAYMQ